MTRHYTPSDLTSAEYTMLQWRYDGPIPQSAYEDVIQQRPANAKKICLDCRHCLQDGGFYFCKLEAYDDPVTGQPRYRYCQTARDFGECGAEGKNWEARA